MLKLSKCFLYCIKLHVAVVQVCIVISCIQPWNHAHRSQQESCIDHEVVYLNYILCSSVTQHNIARKPRCFAACTVSCLWLQILTAHIYLFWVLHCKLNQYFNNYYTTKKSPCLLLLYMYIQSHHTCFLHARNGLVARPSQMCWSKVWKEPMRLTSWIICCIALQLTVKFWVNMLQNAWQQLCNSYSKTPSNCAITVIYPTWLVCAMLMISTEIHASLSYWN